MKPTAFIILVILFIPAFSCDQSIESVQPVGQELPLEERLDVICDESQTEYEVYSFVGTDCHMMLSILLEDKGYRVRFDDAVHFLGVDRADGKEGHMTLIPCTSDGDDTRIAMIQYFRGEGRYAATAAEYFEEEGFEIAHPIDGSNLISSPLGEDWDKVALIDQSERSKRYWGCVANRFISGCAGCATVCYLTGPFWGPCTVKCCAGTAVIALVSCAFTVYLGW